MKRIIMITLLATLSSACAIGESPNPTPADTPITPQEKSPVSDPGLESPQNQAADELIATVPYFMAFHACDTAGEVDCHDPRNHMVYLASSDDGTTWSLLPDWDPFPGSVPDVIRRGNTLYIYSASHAGPLVRYRLDTGIIETPTHVQIPGLPAGFVDPSLILDEQGRLKLFFLYGILGSDPAGCAPDETSCVREIGSATEVEGSDGTEFILDDGNRISVTIDSSSPYRSVSDPDIFFDGNQYVLYVSHGPSTSVWVSKELHGEYVQEPSLSGGMLTEGTGGVPAGYFDGDSGQYWTYAHIDKNGLTVIRRAVHSNLSTQLNDQDFTVVLSGESLGLGPSFVVASPGFALGTQGGGMQSGEPAQAGQPGDHPIPEFNPFENMTAEAEGCLREAWGDVVFEEISGFKRPPTYEEEPAMRECLGEAFMPPGEEGGPEFNPFENMTAEAEGCLREAWGDAVFEEISGFERPPTYEEEPAMRECLGEAFMPPGEEGGPDGGHNPFTDQTYYATSSDGLNWTTGTLLAEKASVPDVIRRSDGSIWAYWVDFTYMTGPNMEEIGIARSTDNGGSWEMLGNANFGDLGGIVPVDPDVIELPDGRLRMYFFDIAVRQADHPIYSAISEDGINFTLEDGVRLWMENIYDPDVVKLPGGGYRMYVNSEDILSAHSSDGLTFSPESGVRIQKGAVPGSILMPDGTIRTYACVDGISVYQSQDGLNYSVLKKGVIRDESGERKTICDPSVTALDDGFLIVYKTNAGNQ